MAKKKGIRISEATVQNKQPADDTEVTKDLKKPTDDLETDSDDIVTDLESQIDDAISRGDWAEVTRLRYGNQPRPEKAGDPMFPPSKE